MCCVPWPVTERGKGDVWCAWGVLSQVIPRWLSVNEKLNRCSLPQVSSVAAYIHTQGKFILRRSTQKALEIL